MVFSVTSTFSFTGDMAATLNTLTNVQGADATKTLATLSTVNYPTTQPAPNAPVKPNADNQLVFMNQSTGWWLENLNSGAVYYLPFSNYVNWGYKDASGNVYHIDMTISNLLMPNKTKTTTRDSATNAFTIVFEEKFGMGRTDVRTM